MPLAPNPVCPARADVVEQLNLHVSQKQQNSAELRVSRCLLELRRVESWVVAAAVVSLLIRSDAFEP